MAMMADQAVLAARERSNGHAEPGLRVRVTLEVLLYALLALAAVGLRFVALGDAPLNDDEAARALGALRMIDQSVPGAGDVPDSPLTLALHALTSLGGDSEGGRFSERSGVLWCGPRCGGVLNRAPLICASCGDSRVAAGLRRELAVWGRVAIVRRGWRCVVETGACLRGCGTVAWGMGWSNAEVWHGGHWRSAVACS